MHSLHNYQRNQENQRNIGGNSGNKNKDNRSNDYGTNKSAATKSSNEKTHDHSSSLDKQEQDKNHNKMPILNEKMFASKCTISDNNSTTNKVEQQSTSESANTRGNKDDLKEKESNSQKTSKNNSTDSEPSNQETGNRESINLISKNLNQAKSGSSYSTSIQQSVNASQQPQSTPLNSASAPAKLTGIPVLNRVFVGGISTDTTENELQALFSQFGTIKAVKIIIDREGVPKGYGFITYTTEDEANKVLKESDNLVLKNRKLNVAIAIKKQSTNPNLTRNFDLNQYFQNGNMFYMSNGLNSIPAAYMNEYPISFPDTYAAYALPHLNSPFAPYPQLVYRPSSLYFPSANVSMHPSAGGNPAAAGSTPAGSTHPQTAGNTGTHLPFNLQQSNAQDTSQYSNQQTSMQTSLQTGAHANQTQQQTNQQSTHHHHSNRLSSNSSNLNSNQLAGNTGGSGNQQQDASSGYHQSQYHHHPLHMNQTSGFNQQHHNTHHQHISAHQPSHTAQTNLANTSQSGASNQQHTPVFINTTSMPYIHPLSLQSLQYNPNLASAISASVPAFTANTTQPHQTSLTHHQPHYTHNPLSSQQVNQFSLNPNWVHNSQWR